MNIVNSFYRSILELRGNYSNLILYNVLSMVYLFFSLYATPSETHYYHLILVNYRSFKLYNEAFGNLHGFLTLIANGFTHHLLTNTDWPFAKILYRKDAPTPAIYKHDQKSRMIWDYFYAETFTNARYVGFIDTDSLMISIGGMMGSRGG